MSGTAVAATAFPAGVRFHRMRALQRGPQVKFCVSSLAKRTQVQLSLNPDQRAQSRHRGVRMLGERFQERRIGLGPALQCRRAASVSKRIVSAIANLN